MDVRAVSKSVAPNWTEGRAGVEAPTNRLLFENPGPVILSCPPSSPKSQTQPSFHLRQPHRPLSDMPSRTHPTPRAPPNPPRPTQPRSPQLVSAAGKQSRQPRLPVIAAIFMLSASRARGGGLARCNLCIVCTKNNIFTVHIESAGEVYEASLVKLSN